MWAEAAERKGELSRHHPMYVGILLFDLLLCPLLLFLLQYNYTVLRIC